ncbi:MAG: hypothetical protein PHI59_03170 [Candidatus Omnitrophica bacterium]|nr:hypothetical protein [Candidatus Omnitrophota bacterium]
MTKKKKKVKAKKAVTKKKVKAKPRKIKSVKSKKPIKGKARKAKKAPVVKEEGTLVGKITHYFPHVKAGAIIIQSSGLSVGDTVRIKGHTTDFKQTIASMQIDRNPIDKASKGQEIGILVKSRVRIHDKVYKI